MHHLSVPMINWCTTSAVIMMCVVKTCRNKKWEKYKNRRGFVCLVARRRNQFSLDWAATNRMIDNIDSEFFTTFADFPSDQWRVNVNGWVELELRELYIKGALIDVLYVPNLKYLLSWALSTIINYWLFYLR